MDGVDGGTHTLRQPVNLSALYAMFPGNQKLNVVPLWLSEDHHARLSSVFAPSIGHPYSEDLDAEYRNIFETRTGTLSLDSRSYATFSTKSKDRVRRSKLIEKYGLTEGITRFAADEAV